MTSVHVGTLDQPAAAGRVLSGEPLMEVTGVAMR